jgi:DNA-binding transcriptional regulator YbjK
MVNRREQLLDAAIQVLAERGVRGLTHRAVDAAAAVPAGSTSNHFRTRDALFDAVVARIPEVERAHFEDFVARVCPTTPLELARTMAQYAVHTTGSPHRAVTMARYAILVEAGIQPSLRPQLFAGGARINVWFNNWLKIAGCADPERDAPILMNHWTGVVLHQLAMPDPAFDPYPQIATLISALIPTEVTP